MSRTVAPSSRLDRRHVRRGAPIAALALAALAGGLVVGAAHVPGRQRVAERFAQAWRHGDYAAMHALLTPDAQRRVSVRALAAAYRTAAQTATARGIHPGRPRPVDGSHDYLVPVTVATAVFGPVHGTVRLPLEGDGEDARVRWRANLAFPGVPQGARLERRTVLPARAAILARDGTPLAQGADRSSPLGDVAHAVVGQIGPPPPERLAALRAAGYPDDAEVGTSGLERIFEARLAGHPGGELRAGGRLLAGRPSRAAPPVRTTIAPSVQRAAVTALAGRLGGVVALRPRTGEVLGFAGIAFSGLQPPGSTFKIITLTGVLEARLAGPGSTYPYATSASLSGVALANANGESCGGTLATAFAVSCNSVFAPLGARLGAQRLVSVAERFGFNRPAPIPGAAQSTIPPAAEIGDDLAVGSSAIGQGRVQATALQMASVAATIALDGRLPRLTLDARGPGGPGERATSARVAHLVRRLMIGVVRGGTGRAAALPDVTVAGKTGTAELKTTTPCVPDPANPETCPPSDQVNDPTDTDAWFAAFAPALAPRVAVGVLLVGAGAGGDTAAPVAREVLRAALD